MALLWIKIAVFIFCVPETCFPSSYRALLNYAAAMFLTIGCIRFVIPYQQARQNDFLKSVYVMYLLALIYMAAVGLFLENELKYIVADINNFIPLIAGLGIGGSLKNSEIERFLKDSFRIASALLVFTVVGLIIGIIPSAQPGARSFTIGLFACCKIICFLFPFFGFHCVLEVASLARRFVSTYSPFIFVLFASIISGTRSIFILLLAATFIRSWSNATYSKRGLITGVVFLLIFSCILTIDQYSFINFQDENASSVLVKRLATTNLEKSSRLEEAEMLFEYLQGYEFTGRGFGSRFWSVIGEDGGKYVLRPHIGALGFFQKGGIGVFLMCFLFPCGLAFTKLFVLQKSVRPDPEAGSRIDKNRAAGSIIIYATIACMSGGFSPLDIIFFGLFFGLLIKKTVCSTTLGDDDHKTKQRLNINHGGAS